VLWLSLALSVGGASLYGCAAYPPAPSTYDRAWSAALGAAQDAGVQVASADPGSGVIRGARDGVDVTVVLAPQADGSVHVRFDAKGPPGRDPGLSERFTQAYNRRMGR
jgi:hypothetical protein